MLYACINIEHHFLIENTVVAMNSIEKVVWILKRLSLPPYSMTLAALSKELRMSRSGAYKILNTLKEGNFLHQDPGSKQYRLGVALYRLGNEFSNRLGIWDVAEGVLKELLDESKETVSIGILEGDTPFLAYRLVSSAYSHLGLSLGVGYPLHASAIGKCLAAYMDAEYVRELLQKTSPLKRFTKWTVTDVDALVDEYRVIRERGYSTSYEEHRENEAAVAAPISLARNAQGEKKVSLALSVGGVTSSFDRAAMERITPRVIRAASRIAEKLTYRTPAFS